MAIKQTYGGLFPTIWRGEAKMLPGGFKPLQNFAVGTTIRRATPVVVDFSNFTCAIVKLGKVLTGSTTKVVRVAKGMLFQVGDYVAKKGTEYKATVTSIDYSNDSYDVLNLSAAITGLVENDILLECSAESATPKYAKPNAVIGADHTFEGIGIDALDVAYEAVVIYPAAYPVLNEWLTSFSLTDNPSIKYIRQ